jgi:hypothetical protein
MLWGLAALALMFALVASSNRGFGRRLVRLGAEQVSFVSWAMVVLCALVGLAVIWFSFRTRAGPKEVILRTDLVVIPKASINGGFITVRYSDIWDVATRDVAGEKMLVIATSFGESRLLSSAFANFGEFSEFSSKVLTNWATNKRVQVMRETPAPGA